MESRSESRSRRHAGAGVATDRGLQRPAASVFAWRCVGGWTAWIALTIAIALAFGHGWG